MAFSDQRQFLVSIAGLAGGFWAQTSGGAVSLPSAKAYDGGNPKPQVLLGNPVVDDLVCTRNYDASVLAVVSKKLKATLMSGTPFTTTITQTPTNGAFKPTGDAGDAWKGVLTKVQTPVTDATKSGANAATLALTFTCTSIA
jgi:hypothetical protein